MRRRIAGLAALALTLAAALACSSPPPREQVVHVLKPGETIYRLSQYYQVPVADIVRANRIADVSDVAVGTRLVIPRAHRAPTARSLAVDPAPPPHDAGGARDLAMRESSLDFAWPLRGRFSSGFGRRGFRTHQGIDIAAPAGTPVRAAEAGRVTHSGWLGDYGRVVIVKHAGHYSTVYAHNRSNKVRKGAFVEKGDVVAEVGRSGNASGAHLHFEIRRDREPEDPLAYLPSGTPAARAPTR